MLQAFDPQTFSVLKVGGTPNPQGKKVGVTPNHDKIFASAARSPFLNRKCRVFVAPSTTATNTHFVQFVIYWGFSKTPKKL